MTKFFIVLFSALTLGVGYLTFNDIGLQDTNFSDNSVRSGSGGTSGYRYGK
ncbi:MAG: hypothetical protein U9N52_12590 [Campylobacterota bacterium]|nr:hypothetical protein [Campylobacterota bacterium]